MKFKSRPVSGITGVQLAAWRQGRVILKPGELGKTQYAVTPYGCQKASGTR